jgi:Gamma-glutamyl cyclotransferase, AIG2-like
MENLFSYETLQSESVQLNTFGRKLEGHSDCLVGYNLFFVKIEDEAVIASSGITEHPKIQCTTNSNDTINGTVFTITQEELYRADEYEVDDYKRIEVLLRSGKRAWVFVSSEKKSISA